MKAQLEQQLSEYLKQLYVLRTEEQLLQVMLHGLQRLIGGDNAIFCRHSLVTKQALQVCLTVPFTQTAYLEHVNASGAALDHPIWQAITEDPTAPVQLSQLMSRRQWEAHPLYAEFFRYDGVADHMTIDLPGAAGVSDMIGVMRSSRGFGELEEQVFRIITPHIRQALCNCRRYQKPVTQLPMVDPDRELKQHCNQWVVNDWQSFCDIVGRRRDFWHKQTGLSVQAFDASAIRCWAEVQCHQLSNGTFAGRLTPLSFVGPTATLELKLLRNWDGRGYCLLEMLEYASGDDPLRALTPRQKELLRWIGEGKTDREIGIILGLSLHTVKSYLKALYRVLGVRNRTEAGRFYVDRP